MQIDTALSHFTDQPLLQAARSLFRESLNIPLSPLADTAITPQRFFRDNLKDAHSIIESIYLVGRVEDDTFGHELPPDDFETVEAAIGPDYEGLFILAVDLGDNHVTRTELSGFTRDFNRAFKAAPVIVVYKYDHDQTCISLASCERSAYRQQWREGEKPGKVSLLKDILPEQPHAAHLRFLLQLTVPARGNDRPSSFRELHKFWQRVFDNRVLNEEFYKKVAAWYQYAIGRIRLPDCPAHFGDDSEAHVKDFTVRLICRVMFCWFLKERGLIPKELLELRDFRGNAYPLVQDSTEAGLDLELFKESSSYYRAILQNLFFNALHTPIAERSRRSTEWYREDELHADFDWSLFERVPFINAALFERDEGDNVSNRSEEGAFSVPNELFYSEEIIVQRGAGARNRVITQGLNRIFAQYKFTIEENTSLDEEVALDPELLGMVFENLLAEIDPNEDGSAKSARNESGAYYTPRRIIDYMVNESLRIHLRNAMGYREGTLPEGYEDKLENLLYFDELDGEDTGFRKAIVEALDIVKILDPACGSGAFPVGMLNRMVNLLKQVDPENHLWIELQVQRLPDELQEQTRQDLLSHDNNYPRKLGLIRNAIYGIDIQPMAVMITKLRFFISLLIDQKIDLEDPASNYGMEQLPNMETKVICANSLQNFEPDLIQDAAIADLTRARKRYYQRDLSPAEQAAELDTIITKLDEAFPDFYKAAFGHPGLRDEVSRGRANRKCLDNWFHFGSMAAPFFNLRFFFPEVAQHGGFDIVIGNPPYGGTKISNELKDQLGLGSRDPYGAFISRFVANHPPLKKHGVLSYIVSDTFMTIKTHKPLREQLLQSFVHRMIRVHPDTFKATVNTAIIVIEREEPPSETGVQTQVSDDHSCLMGDLTQVSIHDHYTRFLQLLYRTTAASEVGEEANGDVHLMSGDDWRSESSPEYALYRYPQNLILSNSNIPFFVASPKLFGLMNDTTAPVEYREISGNHVPVRTVEMNGSATNIISLDHLAEAKVGLQTGDNDAYLFQDPEARGNYRSIHDYADYLLTDSDLNEIRSDEVLRLSIAENGISKNDVNSERYFNGRYIVPYDKGGESDADGGWMPNYWVPTKYFIDWSEWAIFRMKTLTLREKNRLQGKSGGNDRLTSRFQNTDTYFKEGITFSYVGVYAPNFRVSSGGVYDVTGSSCFDCALQLELLLPALSNLLVRFVAKAFIDPTVIFQIEEFKDLPVVCFNTDARKVASELTSSIFRKQRIDPRYDYASNEQLEIDRLVYEAYGLNEDDIREVENWYARRYPALAAAQRANLERKLAAEAG
ncbi:MAG: Eco57I restriction-modification methylase domain-containing protein [Lentimonas sp.]